MFVAHSSTMESPWTAWRQVDGGPGVGHCQSKEEAWIVSPPVSGEAKTLLLATDGSHFSEGAVQEAIFSYRPARPRSLSSMWCGWPPSPSAPPTLPPGAEALEPYLDHLRAMAQDSGVTLEIVVVGSSKPEKTIVEQARLRQADVLAHGAPR